MGSVLKMHIKKIVRIALTLLIMVLALHSKITLAEDQALKQLQLLQNSYLKKPNAIAQSQKKQSHYSSTVQKQLQNRKNAAHTSASKSHRQAKKVPKFSPEDLMAEDAFDKVQKRLFPLKHDQVLRLHQRYNAAQFSLAATPGTPPRAASTSQIVRLAPGSTPPIIRLAQGFVTSVVFLDSTGAPWPIVAYDIGNPSLFNVQWDKSGNTLMMQSNKLYSYGNMAIKLQGLNTPVMITIVPGQKAVDYRIDMRVQGYGPNAKMLPTGLGLPPSADNELLKVLDGIPPTGSNKLYVKGGPAKAWLRGDRMFVRTRLTVLSPGWIATMTSADGTHAYEMPPAPVLLVSWHGKLMQIKLEGL